MNGWCPTCQGTVPVASTRLPLTSRLRMLPAPERQTLTLRAMSWLLERHPGLHCYEGITSRRYAEGEQVAIALETGVVADLPCPFLQANGGCSVGLTGPPEPGPAPYLWLPTLIARALDPEVTRDLVVSRQVADVKVALLSRASQFVRPEMVVSR